MTRAGPWLALLVGIAFSTWMFTAAGLFPAHPLDAAFSADDAAHVIGQRYFIRDAWRWPLLVVPRLEAPDGVNIALTDSIPLAALVLKLFRNWLPDGFTVTAGWIAIAFALQPLAAVFALRGAGERRLVPALAISVISLSMPTLLVRMGHDALCSHFLLLTAIGLYFRLVSPAARHWWLAVPALLLTALLVHPYLMGMSVAVLAAAPLTLLLRRDRNWISVSIVLALSCALTGGAIIALGYTGSQPAGGFGFYSMNLFGPLVPAHSALVDVPPIDATGGQIAEGYQYLGAGVLLLAATALGASLRGRQRPIDMGLILACAALFCFALSNEVYAGHVLLLHIHHVPSAIEQFRATGRFFWPVAYVVVVASIAALGRRLRAASLYPLLLLLAGLQAADAAKLRSADYWRQRIPDTWTIPHDALLPAFSAASRLTLWPTFGCGASVVHESPFMQLLLMASVQNIATNTMYAARTHADPECDAAAVLGKPWEPGDLRIILPPAGAGTRRAVPDFERRCRAVERLTVCSDKPETLAGLQPFATSPIATGIWLDAPALADNFASGWDPEGAAAWSNGPAARIVAELALSEPAPTRLSLRVQSLAPVPGGSQHVWLDARGQAVAAWDVPEGQDSILTTDLPPGPLDLTFHIEAPVRPVDRKMNDDTRPLGLLLRGLKID